MGLPGKISDLERVSVAVEMGVCCRELRQDKCINLERMQACQANFSCTMTTWGA